MKKNKKLKGFTLIELIVVMAIFGILMVAVMSVIDPLSKLMKRASIQEANSAAVDNIKRYFEGSLRYAECLETFEGGLIDNDGKNYDNYSTGEMSQLGATDNETAAVINFIDNHYTDRTNAGTDNQLKGKVRMLKIDNGAGGVVSEYEWDFEAGYTYMQFDMAGNVKQKPATDNAGLPVYTLSDPNDPNSALIPVMKNDLGRVHAKLSNQKFDSNVINPVYYENYSFLFTPGYNEMQTIFDDSVVNSLFDTSEDGASDYYAYVTPVVASNGSTYGSFSPEMFSISVITYRNDSVTATMPDDPNTTEIESQTAFKSPFALSNVNMSLVNIRSSFSGSSSDKWGPIRYSGKPKINGVLAPNTYTPLANMVDTDGDTVWDYERIGLDQAAKIDSNFFKYAPAATDDGCIYFIYTLPELA